MTLLDEENSIRRYLLGDLSSGDREALEEQMFLNSNFSALVDAIEDELIDDYLHGRLESKDREQFERTFLTTSERQERLEFARVFAQGLVESDEPRESEPKKTITSEPNVGFWGLLRSQPRLALGFASVLIVITIGAVLWQRFNRGGVTDEQVAQQPGAPSPVDNTHVVGNNNANSNSPEDVAVIDNRGGPQDSSEKGLTPQRKKPSPVRSVFVVVLNTGLLRSQGGVQKFAVPGGSKTVSLRLRFNDDTDDGNVGPQYEAELQSGELKTILRTQNLRYRNLGRGEHTVDFVVPAHILAPGNYQVLLRKNGATGEVENTGTYYFVVSTN